MGVAGYLKKKREQPSKDIPAGTFVKVDDMTSKNLADVWDLAGEMIGKEAEVYDGGLIFLPNRTMVGKPWYKGRLKFHTQLGRYINPPVIVAFEEVSVISK